MTTDFQQYLIKVNVYFFRLSFRSCIICIYNCDDHPSLSFNSSLRSSRIWFSYVHNFIIKSLYVNMSLPSAQMKWWPGLTTPVYGRKLFETAAISWCLVSHEMMSVQMSTLISYWWFNINFAPVHMPLISVLLLLYCRVRLPWTDAFSAVPIICFGFQVCTSLAIYNHKIFLFTGKQLQLYTVDVKVCFKHQPISCTWKSVVAYLQEIILFSNFPWTNPKYQARI